MKRTAAVAVVALALAPCAPLSADEEGPAAGYLAIYHWFDYMPQELLAKFSAETGIEVTMDVYESNAELLATLRAGRLGLYDVAVPSDYLVRVMADEGMLDEIAPGELTNVGNIEARWLDVPYDPGPPALDSLPMGHHQFRREPRRLRRRHRYDRHPVRPAGGAARPDQHARRTARSPGAAKAARSSTSTPAV